MRPWEEDDSVDMAVDRCGLEKRSGLGSSVRMNELCRTVNDIQYLGVSKLLLSVGASLPGPCVYSSVSKPSVLWLSRTGALVRRSCAAVYL
jgi:hypothetical protein